MTPPASDTSLPPDAPAGGPQRGEPGDSSSHIVTRNFITLGSGEVLSRLFSGVATIYLARSLGSAEYGVVGFASAILLYCTVLVDGGLEFVGPREIAQGNRRVESAITSLLAARLVVAVGLALLLAAAGVWLAPQPEGLVMAVFAPTLLATAVSTRWVHLGLERTRLVAGSRIIVEAVKLALLLLLVRGPADVALAPLAYFAAEGLSAGLQLYWLRRRGIRLSSRLDSAVVRDVLRQSWPLLPTMLLSLAIYNSDVVILRVFQDRTQVGYYLAAYALINLLGNVGVSVRMSLVPTLARLTSGISKRLDLYHTTIARVWAIGLPIAVGGYFVAPRLIAFIFGISYWSSGLALKFLILSIPFMLVRNVLQAVLIAEGREDYVWRATAWAAVVNVGLNLALIPSLGIQGAAYATVFAEVIRLLIAQRYTQAEGYPVSSVDRLWRSSLATAVMASVLLLIRAGPLWVNVPVGAAVYFLALTLCGGIRLRGLARPAITV